MSGTDTSRWTSQFVIRVAIIAAVAGCVGPLTFALVRSTGGEQAKVKKVATVGQVALNSSPAASQTQTPAARSSGTSGSTQTTVPGTPTTATTTPAVTVVATTSTTITTASTAPQVAVVTVVDADDGKTIVLRRGQRLRVVLSGPAWQFADPTDTSVVAAQGQPSYTPGDNCPPLPGTHCGSMSAEFKALKTGTATVAATRPPCSEAFRCTDDSAKFRLEVKVTT